MKDNIQWDKDKVFRTTKCFSPMTNRYAGGFPVGYWSIDFCKAKDGRWILIDMATGERTWHKEDCEYYIKPKDLFENTPKINEFSELKESSP